MFERRLRSDLSHNRRAGVDAYPDLKIESIAFLDLFGKLLNVVEHGQTGQGGALGIVFMGDRRAK